MGRIPCKYGPYRRWGRVALPQISGPLGSGPARLAIGIPCRSKQRCSPHRGCSTGRPRQLTWISLMTEVTPGAAQAVVPRALHGAGFRLGATPSGRSVIGREKLLVTRRFAPRRVAYLCRAMGPRNTSKAPCMLASRFRAWAAGDRLADCHFRITDTSQSNGHLGHAIMTSAFPAPLCRKRQWPIQRPPLPLA
jgi:hypothetical protein